MAKGTLLCHPGKHFWYPRLGEKARCPFRNVVRFPGGRVVPNLRRIIHHYMLGPYVPSQVQFVYLTTSPVMSNWAVMTGVRLVSHWNYPRAGLILS